MGSGLGVNEEEALVRTFSVSMFSRNSPPSVGQIGFSYEVVISATLRYEESKLTNVVASEKLAKHKFEEGEIARISR